MSEVNAEIGEDRTNSEYVSYPQYRDIFAPNCIKELENKLTASRGKAFFIVHPFYLESQYDETHLSELLNGVSEDKRLERFIQKLKTTLPELLKSGIPIIFLQEISSDSEDAYLENETVIKKAHTKLAAYLQKVGGFNLQQFFVLYTNRGGPQPLKAATEKENTTQEVIQSRINTLKKAGLETGIVAGRDFKPSEGDNSEYYANASDPDYGWGKNAEKEHQGRLLKDYYDTMRQGINKQHPLQVIRLDHCVGEFLRMLAFNDVRPVVTNLTFPDFMRDTASYQPQDYNGKRVYANVEYDWRGENVVANLSKIVSSAMEIGGYNPLMQAVKDYLRLADETDSAKTLLEKENAHLLFQAAAGIPITYGEFVEIANRVKEKV